MCTALTFKTKDFYFGRNLDYEFSYGDEIVITPKNYEFNFRYMGKNNSHYAMIGMAHVTDNYPLYYDAVNEKGLGMAGLIFSGNAVYQDYSDSYENVTQYEFIPWILSQCSSVSEAIFKLQKMRLTTDAYNKQLPVASLHYLIADKDGAITVEYMADGLHIFENKAGVLTNNPPFQIQMFLLNNYMQLSAKNPINHFSDKLDLNCYSRGMGGLGLPGDLSSASRFIRAAFVKMNSRCGDSETESVSQFFHILSAVEQQNGCCEVEPGKYEITIYTSCCNAQKGIYYYTTYGNHQISAVNMHNVPLDGSSLFRYPIISAEEIHFEN